MLETRNVQNANFSRFEPFKRLDTVKLAKVQEKVAKCGICKRGCHNKRQVNKHKGES